MSKEDIEAIESRINVLNHSISMAMDQMHGDMPITDLAIMEANIEGMASEKDYLENFLETREDELEDAGRLS